MRFKVAVRPGDGTARAATSLSQTFAYDSASRLTNASDGTYNAGYSYLANSPLVSQISFRSNSTVRMTTTKQYDYLNRLMSISSAGSGSAASPIASTYLYNDANQRVQVRQEDGTYWLYEYDKLGQLTSGKRYWSDNTPVAGQQFEYAYDDIGNRTSTKAGGDDAGAGLRAATYGGNNLNQYTNRTVPGAADVIGIAYPTATVTANGASAYRKGEYFWKELSLGNTSAPLWTNISVVASLSGTSQTNNGYLFLPKATEPYTYDADGNLTSDGRWTNRWDAENRLFEMESLTSAPAGSLVKMQFAYDHQCRRTSKVVSNWNGSAWQLTTNLHFLYDGWNLLAELNATNGLERSYLWGLDLSGTPQGAGGVGGLLALSTFNLQPSTYFYAYDGNGNVRGMIDGKEGNSAARYDSGPFAEPVRSSGTMAAANPMRFSTKYQDGDSDFFYYGYRFYASQHGKWLSRDPVTRYYDDNIYSMLKNSLPNTIDILGLYDWTIEDPREAYPFEIPEDAGGAARWFSGPILDGESEACCLGKRLTRIIATGSGQIIYQPGLTLESPVPAGNFFTDISLLAHESVHLFNFQTVLSDFEDGLSPYLGRCYPGTCFDKLEIFTYHLRTYVIADQQWKDADYDCQQYGFLGTPTAIQRCSSLNDLGMARASASATKQQALNDFLSCLYE